jgi:hypothetical protein
MPLNKVHVVSHGTGTILGDKISAKQADVVLPQCPSAWGSLY